MFDFPCMLKLISGLFVFLMRFEVKSTRKLFYKSNFRGASYIL